MKALAFDVFGTVVDWRGGIIREGTALGAAKGLDVDWGRFADAWRAQYRPNMDRVMSGDLPWTRLDDLHRMTLDKLLPEFGVDGLTEAEKVHLNTAWHRLEPWPDAVEGLKAAADALHAGQPLQRQRGAAGGHGEVRRSALGLRAVRRVRARLQAGSRACTTWSGTSWTCRARR